MLKSCASLHPSVIGDLREFPSRQTDERRRSMATTIRRLKRSVQKAAKAGGLSAEDTALAAEIVLSIAGTGKVHLSEVARRL
ncbi:MAG: TetR/AcrR family transcriptional regulator C-terminal domain-containing protein, partial [Gemmatimonadales bacterium]